MANFIFNWATAALAAATLDLSTGNYYAHLVTTVPALGHSTVADLVLPTGTYAATPLTGLSYNSTRWTFDSFSFPRYSFVSAPTGVVICKRNGATPATTDGIVCYSDFNNSIGQIISLRVGDYVVNLQFGSSGAINFSYRYQYSSGAYSNTESIPKGIIYLLGSANNTQTFANPNPSKLNCSGSDRIIDRIPLTDNLSSESIIGFDFLANTIKVGKVGILSNNASGSQTLWGSNDNIIFPTGIASNASWSQIGSISSLPASQWSFINSTDLTFWRFIKIQGPLNIMELEFYESTILSPTVNLT